MRANNALPADGEADEANQPVDGDSDGANQPEDAVEQPQDEDGGEENEAILQLRQDIE